MKKIAFILLAFLALACTPQTMEQELSSFLATRSDEPLKGTIWEHQTGEDYNRYLYFSEADVSLFYGLVDEGELQRWSPFYSASYVLWDGEIRTSLTYPLWGQEEHTQSASLIKGEGFTIDLGGDTYTYYGSKVNEIEGQWMWLYAGIGPWEIAK